MDKKRSPIGLRFFRLPRSYYLSGLREAMERIAAVAATARNRPCFATTVPSNDEEMDCIGLWAGEVWKKRPTVMGQAKDPPTLTCRRYIAMEN